jgi:hypothetical protein
MRVCVCVVCHVVCVTKNWYSIITWIYNCVFLFHVSDMVIVIIIIIIITIICFYYGVCFWIAFDFVFVRSVNL